MKSFNQFITEALDVRGDAYQSTQAKIKQQEAQKKKQKEESEKKRAQKQKSDDLRIDFLKGKMRGTHKGQWGTFSNGKFVPD